LSIFISVASYRDPELTHTISDCLAHARFPDHIYFGICWQHDAKENSLSQVNGPQFRIIDCNWRLSRGACWARAEIMKLWNGEEYFLQIDSHHRFVQDWDEKLIRIAGLTGSGKPIITTYCPNYDPVAMPDPRSEPGQIYFDYFTDDGIPLFKGGAFSDENQAGRPIRARFVSAAFLFAPGSFVEEVPYDPDLYFHGEEIMLAVRSYTWGYDLFHPAQVLLWHEYTRQYQRKHWDDHEGAKGKVVWHELDGRSTRKVSQFLRKPFVGKFGCGLHRSFSEYERYAGIDLRRNKVQTYTVEGHEPPNPKLVPEWYEERRTWNVRIELEVSQLQPKAIKNVEFWYVGFHDADGKELYRQDAPVEELACKTANGVRRIVIERQFRSVRTPKSWTVWPFSRTGGWLEKVDGLITELQA
jgi:hypothetical protein